MGDLLHVIAGRGFDTAPPVVQPGPYNITIYRGSTFTSRVIQPFDGDGNPYDLTEFSAYAEVHAVPGDDAVIIDLEPTISEGAIRISLTDEQTEAVPQGDYKWDLILESGEGVRSEPILAGEFTVKNTSTRPPTEVIE